MTQIEVVEPSSRAYQFVWDNYRLCLQYCALPFLVKLGCMAFILVLRLEDNILRQGLVMIPGFFAEGAAVCLLIRIAIEKSKAQGGLFELDQSRSVFTHLFDQRYVLGGTVIYVLTQMAFYVLQFAFLTRSNAVGAGEAGIDAGQDLALESSSIFIVLNIVGFLFFVWAVRLLWVFVPVALGFRPVRFLRVFSSFRVSIYLIGMTLLCGVPVGIVMALCVEGLGQLFSDIPLLYSLLSSVVIAIAQILTSVLSSVAIAYAIFPALSGRSRARL